MCSPSVILTAVEPTFGIYRDEDLLPGAPSLHACYAALASSLAGTLRAQVLAPWAVFNFGSAQVAPWPAWDLSPPTDRKQDTEVLEGRTRVAVALAGRGAPVDWRKFAEAAEIPLLAATPVTTRPSGASSPRW